MSNLAWLLFSKPELELDLHPLIIVLLVSTPCASLANTKKTYINKIIEFLILDYLTFFTKYLFVFNILIHIV